MIKKELRIKEIRVRLTAKENKEIKKMAVNQNKYIAELAREFILRGLKGLCEQRSVEHNRSDCL